MGRPRIKIDVDQLEKLAGINCTYEEMAAFFKCSRQVLIRRFSKLIERGREDGKRSLKRRMFDVAMGYRTKKTVLTRAIVEEALPDGTKKKSNRQVPIEIDHIVEPDTHMMVFLSKQMLGYSEKISERVNPNEASATPQTVIHKWVVRKPTGETVEQDTPPAEPEHDFKFDQD